MTSYEKEIFIDHITKHLVINNGTAANAVDSNKEYYSLSKVEQLKVIAIYEGQPCFNKHNLTDNFIIQKVDHDSRMIEVKNLSDSGVLISESSYPLSLFNKLFIVVELEDYE